MLSVAHWDDDASIQRTVDELRTLSAAAFEESERHALVGAGVLERTRTVLVWCTCRLCPVALPLPEAARAEAPWTERCHDLAVLACARAAAVLVRNVVAGIPGAQEAAATDVSCGVPGARYSLVDALLALAGDSRLGRGAGEAFVAAVTAVRRIALQGLCNITGNGPEVALAAVWARLLPGCEDGVPGGAAPGPLAVALQSPDALRDPGAVAAALHLVYNCCVAGGASGAGERLARLRGLCGGSQCAAGLLEGALAAAAPRREAPPAEAVVEWVALLVRGMVDGGLVSAALRSLAAAGAAAAGEADVDAAAAGEADVDAAAAGEADDVPSDVRAAHVVLLHAARAVLSGPTALEADNADDTTASTAAGSGQMHPDDVLGVLEWLVEVRGGTDQAAEDAALAADGEGTSPSPSPSAPLSAVAVAHARLRLAAATDAADLVADSLAQDHAHAPTRTLRQRLVEPPAQLLPRLLRAVVVPDLRRLAPPLAPRSAAEVGAAGAAPAAAAAGGAGGTGTRARTRAPRGRAGPFRGALCRLVGNAAHGCAAVADACVAEDEGAAVAALLGQCRLDDSAPIVREWALMGVRNMCEVSAAVRAFLEGLQPVGVANPDELRGLGIRARVDADDGRLRLERSRAP